MRKRFVLSILVLLLAVLCVPFKPAHAQAASSKLLITQVKVGGTVVPPSPQEYVTITNVSVVSLSLDRIQIEYAKTPDSEVSDIQCEAFPWSQPSGDYSIQELPAITLEPQESLQVTLGNMLDSRGGSLRVVETADDEIMIHDTVGWNRG